jgi:GntR family transcriptional regulator of arabinose operon
METVDKSRPVPAYRQIQALLRRKIMEEELPADSPLPSEQELVREYHVSRMTARQALMGLVNENVVYRVNGKGTFVAARPEANLAITRGSIGVILANLGPEARLDIIHSPTYYSTFFGAQSILGEEDYDVTILARKSDRLNVQILKDSALTGFLVLYPTRDHENLLNDLKTCGRPFVAVNTPLLIPGINRADIDMYEAGKAAVAHLLERGRKKMALVSKEKNKAVDLFYQGMSEVLATAGLDPALLGPEKNPAGEPADLDFSKLFRNFDAALTMSDALAVKIISAAESAGRKVPEDLAVTGLGNSAMTEKSNPTLTSFRLPSEKLGRAAAKLLLKHINSEGLDKERVTVVPELIVRNST